MCTVTLVPKGKDGFILTSNRDEAPDRETMSPKLYYEDRAKIWYPKDAVAGGTWIGMSNQNRVICLLNGAFEKHERKDSYSKSRGIVVKDFLATDDFYGKMNGYDFENVEPFMMVVVDWNYGMKFSEYYWNGQHILSMDKSREPLIWSSTMLYDTYMKEERQAWFDAFQKTHELNETTLMDFHEKTHLDNKEYGVLIDRGYVKTTSITQLVMEEHVLSVFYKNLKDGSTVSNSFKFLPV